MKFNKEHAAYFKDVVFLIEANSYEAHSIWNDWFNRPISPGHKFDTWQQANPGYGVDIGTVAGRSIVVSVSYDIVDGRRIMYYYGCSLLVDHQMIQECLMLYTKELTWDHGRWAQCDAMNFHHCKHAIDIMNGKRNA